jgi:hypothetical protein
MWALTHMYGSVQYQLSIILWRAHIKSQFILYRVDVNWMKEINLFYSILFYEFRARRGTRRRAAVGAPRPRGGCVTQENLYSHPLRIIESLESRST